MKRIVCDSCGANDFDTKNGNRICRYCGAKYLLTKEDFSVKSSYISMSDDINRLLHKCVEEPENAKKYANLILDIDPDNIDALKYL